MERTRRLVDFWSVLPAFRAVAETEHLPTAGKALHLTPSALSRAVRQLEDQLGHALFDRRGRALVLNDDGRRFLRAVRVAMRTVHEALLALEDERFRGPVHVSAPGPFVPLVVLPAFARLADAHPDLVPHLHALDASAAVGALQRGELDVALLEDAPDAPDLAVRALTRLPHAVFAAPSHPLAGDPALQTDAAFVAPPRVRGREVDGYPSHLPRSVRLRVDRMQAAIDAVRTGRYVAYLPTRVGAAHGFVAHPLDAEAATTLHVVHRASLHLPGRTEALVDALFAVEQAARRGDSAAP